MAPRGSPFNDRTADTPASVHSERMVMANGFTPVCHEQFGENEDEGLFGYLDYYHDFDTGNLVLNEFRGGKPRESRIVSDTVEDLSDMQ